MPEVAPASSTTPSILVRKLRCFRGRHWRKAPPGAIEYQVSHSLRRPHEATGLPGRVLRHPCNYLDVLIADRDRQKSSLLTLRWREPDSNHRSRRKKRRPSREAPRPTTVVSRVDLCLITPSSLSVRHLSSATAERPFTRAGPMVRIRFPPAKSLQTISSSAAEPIIADGSFHRLCGPISYGGILVSCVRTTFPCRQVKQRLSGSKAAAILYQCRLPSLAIGRAVDRDMRRDQHVWHAPERVVGGQRLGICDIEPGSSEMAGWRLGGAGNRSDRRCVGGD